MSAAAAWRKIVLDRCATSSKPEPDAQEVTAMFPHPDSAIQLTVMRYDELLAEAAQMRRAALAVDASRCPSALATARHLVGSGLIRLGAYLQGDAGGSIPVASPLRMSAARTA